MDIYDPTFWMTCAECGYDNGCTFNRKERLEPDFCDWQPEYCYCEKVGGKHLYYGWCCEPIESSDSQPTPKSGSRKTGRAYRRQKKIQKKNRLLHIIHGFDGQTISKTEYVHQNHNSNTERFLKKKTSKKIRKINIGNGNYYRKCQEYQGWVY
jgi:hypothetical protein